MKNYYIYIITNYTNTTLYIGTTNNLIRRIYEHKNKSVEGFSSKYNLKKLVYYEVFQDISKAIEREKQLKNWNRDWKVKLIENTNPEWKDLHDEIMYH
ncbi:MAG: GIY-YIG nuclease family protein [Elusimicrobiota bacterium]|jgi:putative endonuclease|nr:GIY-YIG nuclease family protein [Elusimicrobiota bacterium]